MAPLSLSVLLCVLVCVTSTDLSVQVLTLPVVTLAVFAVYAFISGWVACALATQTLPWNTQIICDWQESKRMRMKLNATNLWLFLLFYYQDLAWRQFKSTFHLEFSSSRSTEKLIALKSTVPQSMLIIEHISLLKWHCRCLTLTAVTTPAPCRRGEQQSNALSDNLSACQADKSCVLPLPR